MMRMKELWVIGAMVGLSAAAVIAGDILTIEARIVLADLDMDLAPNRQLRLQFTRTWGDWKCCDY